MHRSQCVLLWCACVCESMWIYVNFGLTNFFYCLLNFRLSTLKILLVSQKLDLLLLLVVRMFLLSYYFSVFKNRNLLELYCI